MVLEELEAIGGQYTLSKSARSLDVNGNVGLGVGVNMGLWMYVCGCGCKYGLRETKRVCEWELSMGLEKIVWVWICCVGIGETWGWV